MSACSLTLRDFGIHAGTRMPLRPRMTIYTEVLIDVTSIVEVATGNHPTGVGDYAGEAS